MMDIAKSETFKNFNILNKALLFLIKLSKTAIQLTIGILINVWLLNVLLPDIPKCYCSEVGNLLILAIWSFHIGVF